MSNREPAILVIWIESGSARWSVAALPASGSAHCLIQSDKQDLQIASEQDSDGQVSFLRHRLAGMVQRGCDRMWGRDLKPSHLCFIIDKPFAGTMEHVTQRVACNFADWMSNPPVAFFVQSEQNIAPDALLAGSLPDEQYAILNSAVPQIVAALDDAVWELVPAKVTKPADHTS